MQPPPGHVVRLQLRPVSAIWGGMDTQTHSVRTALGRPRFTVICPSVPAVSLWCVGPGVRWPFVRCGQDVQILECLLWCVGPRHGDARCKVVLCLVRLGCQAGLPLLAVPSPGPVVGGRAPRGPEARLRGSLEVLALSLGQCWALGVHSPPLPPQTYSVEFHCMCLQEFFTVLRNHFFNHKLYCGN